MQRTPQETPHDKARVLLIYNTMIPSVYLCGHCQMTELASQGLIDYQSCTDRRLTNACLNWADVVLIGRMDNMQTLRLVRRLKQAGKYLIYILDDDLLNVPAGMRSAPHYQQEDIRRSIREIIRLCDAMLSPSPRLLGMYAADKRQLLTEEPAIEPVAYPAHDPAQPVKIGFAGSIDHKSELEAMLYTALRRVKDIYGDRVQLEFFGFQPAFAKELDIRMLPYCDSYDAYRRQMNDLHWDIGLAPLPTSDFHACKHYNKFTEYSAAGVVGIYSAKPPYDRLQTKGLPGLFCPDDPEAWVKAICQLVEDAPQREKLRQEACRLAQGPFSVQGVADSLARDAQDILAYRAPVSNRNYHLCIERIWGLFTRGWRFVKRHGVHAPAVAVQKIQEKLGKHRPANFDQSKDKGAC